MRFGLWVRALRAPFFTAAVVPVVIGTAVALQETGAFSLLFFALALAGAVAAHAGTNLGNDYYDHKSGNDEANRAPTPFSGGSRVIQEGLIPASRIFSASVTSFLVAAAIGIYFYATFGFPILVIGAIGVAMGFFYTAPPVRLGYRGLGELFVGLGFGTLIVAGSYYVQAAALSGTAFIASAPIAILIAMVLLINEFPDHDADKKVGKRTLVVILGKKRALRLYHSMVVLAYALVGILAVPGIYPIYTLAVFLTLPLAAKAIRISGKNYDTHYILPANAATVMAHLFFGLLFAAGYVAAALF